jgi:hypothetical protein
MSMRRDAHYAGCEQYHDYDEQDDEQLLASIIKGIYPECQ